MIMVMVSNNNDNRDDSNTINENNNDNYDDNNKLHSSCELL